MDALIYSFFAVWIVSFLCLFRLRPIGADRVPQRPRRTAQALRVLPSLKIEGGNESSSRVA